MKDRSSTRVEESPQQAGGFFNGLRGNVLILGVVSFLNDAASEMIYPLLPVFLTAVLGAGPAALGVIEGIAESTASFLKVASGFLSDRVQKRKRWVVGGYILSNCARPLIGIASTWMSVLALRFVDRVGKGVRTSPRDALIAESTQPEFYGKAFGFHRAADHAGAVVGPLLATLLLVFLHEDLRTVFLPITDSRSPGRGTSGRGSKRNPNYSVIISSSRAIEDPSGVA
ncbi:MAG: MFS transporter [Nitrospiria bacterium]